MCLVCYTTCGSKLTASVSSSQMYIVYGIIDIANAHGSWVDAARTQSNMLYFQLFAQILVHISHNNSDMFFSLTAAPAIQTHKLPALVEACFSHRLLPLMEAIQICLCHKLPPLVEACFSQRLPSLVEAVQTCLSYGP